MKSSAKRSPLPVSHCFPVAMSVQAPPAEKHRHEWAVRQIDAGMDLVELPPLPPIIRVFLETGAFEGQGGRLSRVENDVKTYPKC